MVIRADLPPAWHVCMEGLFIAKGDRGPSLLTLAESAGELVGPLRGLGIVARPTAAHWRAKVLRLGRVSAKVAEEYAIRCVASGAVVDGDLGALTGNGHVCEAACIAVYGLWVARGSA